jgi:hypothetical protein
MDAALDRPVQIVSIDGSSGQLLVNEPNLRLVLGSLRDDLPLCVISIAGALRTGKSFVLAILLNELLSRQERRRAGSATFASRWGSRPVTQGIWVCGLVQSALPDGGRPCAVMLMDSQGVFDSAISQQTTVGIFALSLLLSSCFVYNVEKQISEDVLQHASLFSAFATLASSCALGGDDAGRGHAQSAAAFFPCLEFLVRDWQFEGDSAAYLEGVLAPRAHLQDLNETRQNLRSSFARLGATLLPHPGLAVTQKGFDGSLERTSPEFQAAVKAFAARALGSDLRPVMLGRDTPISREGYFQAVVEYCQVLNSSAGLPSAVTLLAATANASNAAALRRALDVFYAKIHTIPDGEVEMLQHAMQLALGVFDQDARFGPRDLASTKRLALERQLQRALAKRSTALQKAQERRTRIRRIAVVATVAVAASPVLVPLAATSAVSGAISAALAVVRGSALAAATATTSASIEVKLLAGLSLSVATGVWLYRVRGRGARAKQD